MFGDGIGRVSGDNMRTHIGENGREPLLPNTEYESLASGADQAGVEEVMHHENPLPQLALP